MGRSSIIPDPTVPTDLVGGLYHPEFIPDDIDVANFVEVIEVKTETVVDKVQRKISAPPQFPPIPLTEEEAAEVDRQIDLTLDRITETRSFIQTIRNKIDEMIKASPEAQSSAGGELGFKLNIRRKKRIKRAIRALFGVDTDVVTYSMYKAMLRAKRELEEEQVDIYVNGLKDDEDDEEGRGDKKSTKTKGGKKEKRKGFLERAADDEESDGSRESEEAYERMFPKIARDFVYKGDMDTMMQGVLDSLDPSGQVGADNSDTEARRRALQYKHVLDAGRDGSKLFDDIIKMDPDEDEE